MDILVDLRSLVGKVDVVPVHSVFDDEVEESERSDERTDDSVGDSEGEHQQHPGVVHAEGELVKNGSSDGGNLSFRLGAAQSEGVHEELWKPHDLQACPYQGAGGHVVDKKKPRCQAGRCTAS